MPVAERSRRPGATTTAFFETASTPRHGSAIWTMLTPRDLGVLGMHAGQLLSRRRRIASPAVDSSRASDGSSEKPSPCASAIAYHMPPNATSTVSVPSPSTSSGASSRSAKQGTFVSSTLSHLPSLHVALISTTPRRRLQPQRRLRLAHLDHPGLEQHGRDAHRVRARHRRILGRLHDDVAGGAVGPQRRHDQVRVHRDATARLAEQQPPKRVVRAQRLHPLEDRLARRRQDPADDHVADLPAGMAADHGDRPARSHRSKCDDSARMRLMASYSVNKKAVAHARRLIDAHQYVLPAPGATSNPARTTRTASWSRTPGTSTPTGIWGSPTARPTTPRRVTRSSTATSGASTGWA